MTNRFYDVMKWIVLVFLPALAVLISGVGELYGWAYTTSTVTTINFIGIFIGSLLQMSSQKYHTNKNDHVR